MASKPFSVGGVGAQPTLDDVVRVAMGQQLALDPSGADRVKKMSPPPKSFLAEPAPSPAEDSALSGALLSKLESRAVVVSKLLAIMNGRSGSRVAVADFLMSTLNAGIQLALPAGASDGAVLKVLADSCHGCGFAVQEGGCAPLLAELEKAGATPPGLSAAERATIESGGSASAGVSALTVQAGKRLLTMTTAAAALSFEAVGAQTKPLDAELVEARGYKSAVTAADELRGLLEGSKRINTLKGGEDMPSFHMAPQVLGAAAEAIASNYAAVRSEVQSEALALKSAAQAPPSTQLASTALELARTIMAVARDSITRTRRVMTTLPADAAVSCVSAVEAELNEAQAKMVAVGGALLVAAGPVPTVQVSLAAAATLESAVKAVSLEALVATYALRLLEGPPAPAEPKPTEVAPEATPEAAPDAAPAGGKKGKEGKKKGSAAGVVLGKGSSLFRSYVEVAASGGVMAADAELAAAWPSVTEVLQPFSSSCSKFLDELREVVEANQARRKPKIAKGARDMMPEQMAIREKAFNKITGVFKRHGAVAIDTPVFELRETLTGKYGEDSKLIYDIADQGGEILSLRYDLTVPFARFVAVHNVVNIKRYHIGKVYRRDQPQMNKGRFREFFQCDFDIAGSYATMVADSEVLKVLVEILTDLQLGEFEVKLNHRKLLDAMLAIAGVPTQKFRAICSAIDKLDKEPWEAVKAEMVVEKGLSEEVADKIGEFVVLRGEPMALLEKLSTAGHPLCEHPESKAALDDMRILFKNLEAMNALGPITFDLSLARGLDYYTGVIYEAVLKGATVGSIAAGGRYDKLVGMFSGKDVPAVGVSIGIERVFAIMEAQAQERAKEAGTVIRATETQVLVASIGNGMQVKRMEIANKLWAAGICAEFGFKLNPKMGDQLTYAFEEAIPFMVLFGEEELAKGLVKIKDIDAKTEEEVSTDALVDDLKRRFALKAE